MMLLQSLQILMVSAVLHGVHNELHETLPSNSITASNDQTELPDNKTTLLDENTTMPDKSSTALGDKTTDDFEDITALPDKSHVVNDKSLVSFRDNTPFNQQSTALFDGDVFNSNVPALYEDQGFYNDSDFPFYYEEADTERLLIDNAIWVTSVPGVICNTITIVVVSRMKPFTTNSLFMLVLGVTDLTNVVTRMASALTYVLETVTDFTCKVLDYVIIASFNFSNTILVCWTVERFIAVWFPLKYNMYCTIRNTAIALTIAGVVMGLLAIPYPMDGYAKQTDYGFVECEYSEFLYSIWTPIETAYYIWIPMLVIGVSNALIIHKLVANRKGNLGQSMSSERTQQRAREQRQMTNVLMAVSLAFLVLHMPQAGATLFLSIKSGKIEAFVSDPFGPLKSILWCFIITEFQNSINFFLYCLTGRDFRAFVVKMFCGCRNTDLEARPKPKSKTASTEATNE